MSTRILSPIPPLLSRRTRSRQIPLTISHKTISSSLKTRQNSSTSSLQRTSETDTLSWRHIQGSQNWENLIEPLHPLLRHEIIRYAELVMACYKAFDLNPSSKRYLNCKYGKSTLLSDIGLPSSGYHITKYIYATPDIPIPTQSHTRCSRWIGYVAVSSDQSSSRLGRRDILVSFRGTITNTEWIANLMSSLTPARLDPHNAHPDVKVESGFLSLYTSYDSTRRFTSGSCREQLLSEISRILFKYRNDEDVGITLAGHSMGSSLALLLGYDIAELGLNRTGSGRHVPITVYSFGGPRVGNSGFKDRCEELGLKVLRVANVNDPVTKMPGVFFNENLVLPWMNSCSCYAHVGVELALDFFKMMNPACVHDLDAYIGWLRCGNKKKEGEDFFGKLREFILSQRFDEIWQDGGRHGEYANSPRIEA